MATEKAIEQAGYSPSRPHASLQHQGNVSQRIARLVYQQLMVRLPPGMAVQSMIRGGAGQAEVGAGLAGTLLARGGSDHNHASLAE